MTSDPRDRTMVDWELAVSAGSRMARPGPAVTTGEAREAVADLHRHAVTARGHVHAVTGLDGDADEGGGVAVIDRPRWIEANAAGFRAVLEPLVDRLREKRGDKSVSAAAAAVGSRVTGLETGALLAFLSSKVLGQYELFPAPNGDGARHPGRLLLVAPNIVAAEREMGVEPGDFRLWVCIHEETHRVQFAAVPWLREHLLAEIRTMLDLTDLEPAELLRRLRAALGAVSDVVRPGGQGQSEGLSLVEAMQTPQQRAVLERITATMSLLEGHADFVMDAVGPEVIPTVAQIRTAFQARRAGAGPADRAVRRLLGLEAKMRQYRDGARFVTEVVDAVGMDGFNLVWRSPADLPTMAEIRNPQAWVARVHPPTPTD